ncbi:MAG: hypothetical protein ACR2I2_23950 [Bryobacteraceae bacterium]
MPPANRLAAAGALLLLLAATLLIDIHTVRAVIGSQTNVLWRDQWWFLGEMQSVDEGKNWAEVLWSPFWGHRSVIPRLLFQADARYFSFRNGPLLCIGWASLILNITLIAAVNRAIFRSFLAWRFAAALIVMLNLYLSSFQLENLIWAFQFQYPLIFFCAALSFVLFALGVRAKRGRLLIFASCLSALIGSLTMAHGLLIWPILAIQGVLCKSSRKVRLGLILIFVILAGVYAIGYQMPQTGMGLRGELKRPMRALEIALMVLGGPIGNQSLNWGVAAGAVGIAGLIALIFSVYRSREPVWPSVHVAIALFTAAAAALTAAGRISPELLKQLLSQGNEILPGRYLTFAFLFWTSLFTLFLWSVRSGLPAALKGVVWAAAFVPLYMVFAFAHLQPGVADAWGDAMHEVDATGTSFLVGAPDWERQKLLWGDRSQLEKWAAFARERRLANFSDDRFLWLNRRLPEQFQLVDRARCDGKVEGVERLADSAWRVTGWAWDRTARKPPADVVLVDLDSRIVGLARSGIRHHDTGGHGAGVVMWRAGWLGYVRAEPKDIGTIKAYAVVAGGACPI